MFSINLIILGIACAIVSFEFHSLPLSLKIFSTINFLTISVWTGTLRLRQVDSRQLFQGQLDLRQ